MAASNLDKFKKSKRKFETTVGVGGILAGGTTLPLTSVTGLDTSTAVTLVIGAGTATEEVVTGVVSGSDLINCVRGKEGTTDSAHSAGETVNMFFTETHWDDAMDGILVDHNQSGYHKTLNDDNGNEWIKQTSTASAVNEITVGNAATGNPATIAATGGDTNIDIKMTGKGTGKAYVDGVAETDFDFVVSGLVWSGDSYGASLAASMTAGYAYISGVRVTVAAVTARAFTASKDTYIDLGSDGVLDYTEVANNAASPALAANHIRIAIIVSGGSSIANVGSINQGQENKILPIASSVAYSVTDSLGNLICPRDSRRITLGYRQITSNATGFGTTAAQITGLTCPVIVPTGRKVKITLSTSNLVSGSSNQPYISIWDGAVNSGSEIGRSFGIATSSNGMGQVCITETTPSSSSKTYNGGCLQQSSGTATVGASSASPAFIRVELV